MNKINWEIHIINNKNQIIEKMLTQNHLEYIRFVKKHKKNNVSIKVIEKTNGEYVEWFEKEI